MDDFGMFGQPTSFSRGAPDEVGLLKKANTGEEGFGTWQRGDQTKQRQ